MDTADVVETLKASEDRHALCDTSLPDDFFKLTPSQLGISAQSFTPSSNHQDKSRLAQLKSRRRSNVGVRGSPETNSLIRYIAQQRMKSALETATPQQIKASPFSPRVSTLKQKMASFQSIMDVEENRLTETVPKQNHMVDGCINTRDQLSGGRSRGKENGLSESPCPSLMTPPPSKRRCMAPLRECVGEIREANTPILRSDSLKEQEAPDQPARTVTQAAQCVFPPAAACEAQPAALSHCSFSTGKQECSFEGQGPPRAMSEEPAAGGPTFQPLLFTLPSLPSLVEMKPTEDYCFTGTSTAKKRKRVRFGRPLSPEFFDRDLPPSTPLQRGATPAHPGSATGSQLRSALKTPQRSEPRLVMAQPDFSSPSMTGASPPLGMGPGSIMEQDNVFLGGQIPFPSMEDADMLLEDSTEPNFVAQPLDLNAAFQEVSSTEPLADPVPEPCVLHPPLEAESSQSEPQPEEEPPSPATQSPAPALSPSLAPAPARLRGKKRKLSKETEPVKKRSTRTSAKSASGKMKSTVAKRGWGSKEVNRALYGSREYASKCPVLSPITETLSGKPSLSPKPQHQRTRKQHAKEKEEGSAPSPGPLQELTNSETMAPAPGRSLLCPTANETVSATESRSQPPDAPAEPFAVCKGRTRRRSGPKQSSSLRAEPEGQSRRRGKARKVSVPVHNWLIEEDPTAETGNPDEHEGGTATADSAQADVADTLRCGAPLHSDMSGDAVEGCCVLGTHTELCPPLDVDSPTESGSSAEPKPAKAKDIKGHRGRSRGRKSYLPHSVQEEGGDQVSHVDELKTRAEVEEGGRLDPAASPVESHSAARTPSQCQGEDGPELGFSNPDSNLPQWQDEFNIEDVFKPLATRGQRSVRRSLRIHSCVDPQSGCSSSAGLAWLPHISPDSIREERRKTRGRRLSAALLLQPPISEKEHELAH